MLTPNTGKLVTTRGKTAQWIAQATEVVIPNASQLILIDMQKANILNCNNVAEIYFVHLVV